MKRYWQKQYRRTKYRGVAADLPAHESRAWLTDCNFNAMRKNEAEQPLEKVGAELRKLYSWNDTDKLINN